MTLTMNHLRYWTHLYSTPIMVRDRSPEPNKLAGLSTTPDPMPLYIPTAPIQKGLVVRAQSIKEGEIPSEIVTHTYFIQDEVDRPSLPIVAITVQKDRLFDYDIGIMTAGEDWTERGGGNWNRRGRSSERPAHFAFFEAGESTPSITQDVGLRIHGSFTRRFHTKSLRIYARAEYGSNKLDYPFFSELGDSSFTRLLLRNSGNDYLGSEYPGYINFVRKQTMFRDAALQGIASPLRLDTQAYRPVIHYINGEYWGIINLRERYDRYYLKRVHGVEHENLDFLEANGRIIEGENSDYLEMIDFLSSNDMTCDLNYDYISRLMDIDNFTDFYIANIFFRNDDWPANNVRYWRARNRQSESVNEGVQDSRWRWVLFDTDFGFGSVNLFGGTYEQNTLAHAADPDGGWFQMDQFDRPWATFLFRQLLTNEEFVHSFINRFADLLNSVFLPERTVPIIDSIAMKLEDSIPRHLSRWKGTPSFDEWLANIQDMRDFAHARPDWQRRHIVDFFELPGLAMLSVDCDPTKGQARVNSLDLENELPDGESTWEGSYFLTIPVEVEVAPKDGYVFAGWRISRSGDTIDANSVTMKHSSRLNILLQSDTKLEARFELAYGSR